MPPTPSRTAHLVSLFAAPDLHHAARDVEARLGKGLTDQLVERGVLRASVARWWACGAEEEGPSCPRRVLPDPDRLDAVIAACGATPARCPPVRLGRDEARELSLGEEAAARWLAELLGLGPTERRSKPPVFVLGRAGRLDVLCVMAGRNAATRAVAELGDDVVVLVAADVPGGRRQVVRLADVLSVGGDAVTATLPREARVAAATLHTAEEPAPEGGGPLFEVPEGLGWEDLRLTAVDGHTLRAKVGGKARRFSFVELGMATKSKKPSLQFLLLAALCENGGTVSWRGKEQSFAMRMRMSRLREDLRRVFGLGGDPFKPYVKGVGYVARFFVVDSGNAKELLKEED